MLQSPAFHRFLLISLFFAALAPTLNWIEFSGGMENFNLETAVEVQREGHWLIPTLNGEPRVKKPPLVHWITAAGIALDNPQPKGTATGWSARWPSLLAACLTLVAIYELGRVLGDEQLGLTSAAVAGSSILFLKFAWQASYDLHLALWVITANVFLAHALFKGRRWIGSLGTGAALGLALMCKGPVALLQSVVPAALFVLWFSWQRRSDPIENRKSKIENPLAWIAPSLLAIALMLLITLPWVFYVSRATGHGWRIWDLWLGEVVLRDEAFNDQARIKWHSYIVFFPMMLPWLGWFFSGFVEIIRTRPRSAVAPLWLAILWLVLPIVVMTFFPERRDRYLLPMIGAASVITAFGVLRHAPRWHQTWNPLQKLLLTIHIGTLVVLTFGMTIWGSLGDRLPHPLLTVDGKPWYTPAIAAIAIAATIVTAITSWVWYRRSLAGLVAGTSLLMLLWFITFQWGYKDSTNGRSDGKALVAQLTRAVPDFADAAVFDAAPNIRPELPLELLIYLNRPVPNLYDPQSLVRGAHPQVLIYPPDSSHPDYIPDVPANFRLVASQKINTGLYRAYAR